MAKATTQAAVIPDAREIFLLAESFRDGSNVLHEHDAHKTEAEINAKPYGTAPETVIDAMAATIERGEPLQGHAAQHSRRR